MSLFRLFFVLSHTIRFLYSQIEITGMVKDSTAVEFANVFLTNQNNQTTKKIKNSLQAETEYEAKVLKLWFTINI